MDRRDTTTSPTTTVATAFTEAFDPEASGGGRCQLVVVDGPDMGRAAPLELGTSVVVGSSEGADLVLTDDRVSRRHVEVLQEGAAFRVRDLGSTNGTMYEGARVAETLVLPGATLKVGHSFLRVQPEPQALDVAPSQSRRFGDMVAESLVMREVFAVLELVAEGDVTVLLEGETGTGKELAARAVHEASRRRKGAFVALDCGALPEGLVESELFGHVRGAFTGAMQARDGAFVRANGGTLFLDELDSVPAKVQARLLRVLEDRTVRPVGGDRERMVDVRIVAACRRDLATLVADGHFRPDLFYRVAVLRVKLPALRMRREDIPPIVSEMLRHRGLEAGPIAGPNLHALMAHGWPGNVRELRNLLERGLALRPGAQSFADLRLHVQASSTQAPLSVRCDLPFTEAKQHVVDEFERRYLADLLERAEGNVSKAARMAQMDRKHLHSLLRRHGLA